MFLRPASSLIVTVVRAHGTLAGSSFVSSEALAFSRGTVASSLVGALRPRMEVVRVDGGTDPSEIEGACA
jgi:hypothetical protein